MTQDDRIRISGLAPVGKPRVPRQHTRHGVAGYIGEDELELYEPSAPNLRIVDPEADDEAEVVDPGLIKTSNDGKESEPTAEVATDGDEGGTVGDVPAGIVASDENQPIPSTTDADRARELMAKEVAEPPHDKRRYIRKTKGATDASPDNADPA